MKKTLLAAAACCALLAPATASAATIVVSLGDFDGDLYEEGFPIDLGTIGTFEYSIDPGAVITSAFIGGTFGTDIAPGSTASFDVVVDGLQLTACPEFSPTCWEGGDPFRPFDIELPGSSYGDLLDGSVDLGIIQTTGFIVRYGTPTLTINYEAVPEASTWAMMILGLGFAGMGLRRRQQQVTVTYA